MLDDLRQNVYDVAKAIYVPPDDVDAHAKTKQYRADIRHRVVDWVHKYRLDSSVWAHDDVWMSAVAFNALYEWYEAEQRGASFPFFRIPRNYPNVIPEPPNYRHRFGQTRADYQKEVDKYIAAIEALAPPQIRERNYEWLVLTHCLKNHPLDLADNYPDLGDNADNTIRKGAKKAASEIALSRLQIPDKRLQTDTNT